MKLSLAAVSTTVLFLGGCAIHPLPDDVTRHSTYQIVEKIRCEGREALDNITVDILRQYGNEQVRQLADRLEVGDVVAAQLVVPPYRQVLAVGLAEEGHKILERFTLTAATFDFSFDITETNDNRTQADFRLPFVDGVFDLTTRAGAKFERQAWRKFQVTDSFAELHTLRRDRCEAIVAKVGNYNYPIIGKIGLEEVFRTFVGVDTLVGGLAIVGPERFSDALTFTTTVNADANPSLTLAAVPNRFRLIGASANFIASREDEHKVTIALARGALFPRFRDASLREVNARRASAREMSKEIARERRFEDVIIIPRRGGVVIQR
jgi:hypothetical protein